MYYSSFFCLFSAVLSNNTAAPIFRTLHISRNYIPGQLVAWGSKHVHQRMFPDLIIFFFAGDRLATQAAKSRESKTSFSLSSFGRLHYLEFFYELIFYTAC